MRTFKVGDLVRIVKASRTVDRRGTVCQVTSALHRARCTNREAHAMGVCWCSDGLPMVHELRLPPAVPGVVTVYPPDYLEPYWEGKEPSDQTLTEILDGVRGVKAKEGAE